MGNYDDKRLADLEHEIYGNGTPNKGLSFRMQWLEAKFNEFMEAEKVKASYFQQLKLSIWGAAITVLIGMALFYLSLGVRTDLQQSSAAQGQQWNDTGVRKP